MPISRSQIQECSGVFIERTLVRHGLEESCDALFGAGVVKPDGANVSGVRGVVLELERVGGIPAERRSGALADNLCP